MRDFEYAKDKVLMGKERRSLILSDEEKRITAYHEGGHALVAKLLPGTDPVHKVTIIPRGRALGVTMQLPEGDRHGYSKAFLQDNLMVLLAGAWPKKSSSTRLPPVPATTSSALRAWPARWFANGA